MSWARVDDAFYDNPKVLAAGNAGAGLYVRALAYCNKHLTDGVLTDSAATLLAGPDGILLDALVKVGLWDRVDGGYRIPDFLDFNPSAESVRKKRNEDAARKLAARSCPKGVRAESGRTPDGIQPSHPLPTPLKEEEVSLAETGRSEPRSEPKPDPIAPQVRELFDLWVATMGKEPTRTKLDAERERVLRKALANWPIETCRKAIAGCHKSDYHMNRPGGGNDRNRTFNSLDLIFRDAKRVEDFCERADLKLAPVARIAPVVADKVHYQSADDVLARDTNRFLARAERKESA